MINFLFNIVICDFIISKNCAQKRPQFLNGDKGAGTRQAEKRTTAQHKKTK